MNLCILLIIIIMFLGKDYAFDAFKFNLQKSVQHIIIPNTIRCKPRLFGDSQKVWFRFDSFIFTIILVHPVLLGYSNIQSASYFTNVLYRMAWSSNQTTKKCIKNIWLSLDSWSRCNKGSICVCCGWYK